MDTNTAERTDIDTKPLILPSMDAIKYDLAIVSPAEAVEQEPADSGRRAYARDVASRLFSLNPEDMKLLHENQRAVSAIGAKEQHEAALKSEMLKEPIKTIAANAEDGGPVARSLIDLKMQVESLDPARFDFSEGWMTRMLGFMPFIGTPLKRYFTRYETAQTVLAAIRNSLMNGQKTLERDNLILSDDQDSLNTINVRLKEASATAQLVDQYLTSMVEKENDTKRKSFQEQEILFPLRQRITDIQQSIVVNQQGVMAIELLRRTNRELVRGVDRALNTTMSALHVAVTVATAAAHQRIVLDKIEGVNTATNDLIVNTGKSLRENVAQTNKLASNAMLSMDSLRQAFADTTAAIDDVMTFRSKALPQLAATILELNDMTAKQADVIKRLEEGTQISENLANQFNN